MARLSGVSRGSRSWFALTVGLLTAALIFALAAVSPAPVAAQNAGDDQYADPFGEVPEEDGGGQEPARDEGDPGADEAPAPAPAPVPAPAPAAEAVPVQADVPVAGEELPRTGASAGVLATAGLTLLGSGLLLLLLGRARRAAPAAASLPMLGLHTAPRLPGGVAGRRRRLRRARG